jgi:hypothetical protein
MPSVQDFFRFLADMSRDSENRRKLDADPTRDTVITILSEYGLEITDPEEVPEHPEPPGKHFCADLLAAARREYGEVKGLDAESGATLAMEHLMRTVGYAMPLVTVPNEVAPAD